VELRQVVDGRSAVMSQTGDKALKQNSPTQLLAAGGSLRLALWLPGGAKEEVIAPDFPWFTLGISGFVALLTLLALALRLRKAARSRRTAKMAAPAAYNAEAIGGADDGSEDATIIFAGGATDVDVESLLERTGFKLSDNPAPHAAPARAPKAAPPSASPAEEPEHTPKDPLPPLDEEDATPMMPLPALTEEEDEPSPDGEKKDDDVIEFKL
jgi:hypothetical protein